MNIRREALRASTSFISLEGSGNSGVAMPLARTALHSLLGTTTITTFLAILHPVSTVVGIEPSLFAPILGFAIPIASKALSPWVPVRIDISRAPASKVFYEAILQLFLPKIGVWELITKCCGVR